MIRFSENLGFELKMNFAYRGALGTYSNPVIGYWIDNDTISMDLIVDLLPRHGNKIYIHI